MHRNATSDAVRYCKLHFSYEMILILRIFRASYYKKQHASIRDRRRLFHLLDTRIVIWHIVLLCIVTETARTNVQSLNVTKSQPHGATTIFETNYNPLYSPFWVDCTTECQVSCNSIIFVKSCFQQVDSSCLNEYNVYLQLQTSIFDKTVFSSEWLQTLLPFVKIRELDVSDSIFGKIKYLQNNVFDNNQLSYLCTLKLYLPALRQLNNNSFTGLQNLNELTLGFEDITEVESGVLMPLQYTISILSINGVCKNTEEIISKFTGSIYLPDLDIVSLNYNCLHYISKYMFQGLYAVESIYIMHCEISSIHPDAFRPMKQLKQIFLNDNSLTTLDSSAIYYMIPAPKIYVKDNFWNCNCSLKWLNDWLMRNGYYENPKCYRPIENRGKLFTDAQFCTPTTTITPSTETIKNTSSSVTTEHSYYSVASDSFAIQNISSYSYTESTTNIHETTTDVSTDFDRDTTRDTKTVTNKTESSSVNEITTEYQTEQTSTVSIFTDTEYTSNSLPDNFNSNSTNIIDTSESTNTEEIHFTSSYSYSPSTQTEPTQTLSTNTKKYSVTTSTENENLSTIFSTQNDIIYEETSSTTKSGTENMINSEPNTEMSVTNIQSSKMFLSTDITEESTDITEKPTDITEKPTDITEEPTYTTEEPTDVTEEITPGDTSDSQYINTENDLSTQTNNEYSLTTEITEDSTSQDFTNFQHISTHSETSITQPITDTESSLFTEITKETNTNETTDLESTHTEIETTAKTQLMPDNETSYTTETADGRGSEETSDLESSNTEAEATITQSMPDNKTAFLTDTTDNIYSEETSNLKSSNTDIETTITHTVSDETSLFTETNSYETADSESINTNNEAPITKTTPNSEPSLYTDKTNETSEAQYTNTDMTITQSVTVYKSTLTTDEYSSVQTADVDVDTVITGTESFITPTIPNTEYSLFTEMTEEINSSHTANSETTKTITETSATQETSHEETSLMTTGELISTSTSTDDSQSSNFKTETYITETLPYNEDSLITEEDQSSTSFIKSTSAYEEETERTTPITSHSTPSIQTKSTSGLTFHQPKSTSIEQTTIYSTGMKTEETSTLSPITILCETYDYNTKSKCDFEVNEITKPENVTETTFSMPSINDNFYVISECDSSQKDKENPIQLAMKVPDNSAMVWIKSNQIPGNEIYCLSELHGIIFVSHLQYDSMYTFCILKGDDLLTSPFNCLAYKTQEMYDDQPWIMNRDKDNVIYGVTGGVIAALFLGSVCVFAFIRKYPKFIKGKRVLLVKHRIADVMIFPEKIPNQYLNEENLKKYSTDSVASRISSSAQSSTNTYVTINEPTPIEMIAYRFEQIIQRLNYVTNLSTHNHTEH